MSTQSYYKDRLGFDPREALYETTTTIKTSTGRTVVDGPNQRHHSPSPASNVITQSQHHHRVISHQTSGGSGGSPAAAQYDQHHSSPAKKHKRQNAAAGVAAANGGGHNYQRKSPNNGHGQIHQANLASGNGQGGYEDALTQFKGTMSVWDYFVENWDITGTTTDKPEINRLVRVCSCALLTTF